MGIIKEIYDIAKEGVLVQRQITSIKRALKTELKLNRKFLEDIEKGKFIDTERRKRIISNLAIIELTDTVKYEIPYVLICNKIVDKELLSNLNINRTLGYNFEKLVEKLYLMIAYIQKDFDNSSLDLNSRLIFICKYNILLLRMLS